MTPSHPQAGSSETGHNAGSFEHDPLPVSHVAFSQNSFIAQSELSRQVTAVLHAVPVASTDTEAFLARHSDAYVVPSQPQTSKSRPLQIAGGVSHVPFSRAPQLVLKQKPSTPHSESIRHVAFSHFSPVPSTPVDAADARHALPYVSPLHPQTGANSAVQSHGILVHLPGRMAQPINLQNSPAPQSMSSVQSTLEPQ
jgi:hypothetical protein